MSERCAIHPDRAAELTCARCGSFACYECVGPIEGSLCARCRMRVSGGGWTRHVRWLAVLTMVHGALMALMGALYGLVGAVLLFMPPESRQPGDPPAAFMTGFMAAFALAQLAPGLLQVAAGIQLMRGRGRVLAIVALVGGLASVIGCYCLPTAIALAVWGVIVLSDAEVRVMLEPRAAA